MQTLVIDTNIVLDMWVFDDPRSRPLNEALQSGGLRWLASAEMREELLRVLGYPHLVQRMVLRGVSAPSAGATTQRSSRRSRGASRGGWRRRAPVAALRRMKRIDSSPRWRRTARCG